MGSSESTCGFRLIHITESSPAQKSGLQSYIDFIISANGLLLSPDKTLNTIISKSLNCKVTLKVYNLITGLVRDVQIQPSNSWGGDGLLGATVRWENWKSCEGLRVLEVTPDSNAHKMGLKPREDYILGTDQVSINEVSTFEEVLSSQKPFFLYVLSNKTGKIRRVEVNSDSLGCTVGEGMMNSLQNIEIEAQEQAEEEKIVVTVLKKKEEVPPPPPPVVKERVKPAGIVGVLPPPSIYDLSMESLTFQPRVLLSKYVQIS